MSLTLHIKKNTINLKLACSLYLSISPLLYYYKTPLISVSLAYSLLSIFGVLILVFNMINQRNGYIFRIPNVGTLLIVLYLLYTVFRSGGVVNDIILRISLIIWIVFISNGGLDIGIVRKIVEFVSVVVSVILLIQVISHYVFGIHIQVQPISFLNETMQQYENLIKTGYTNEGLYRPSSFFLEPSHFARYASVSLASVLMTHKNEEVKLLKAALISVAILCSTSGMGIILVIALWGWYLIHIKSLSLKIILLLIAPVLAIFILVSLLNIEFFLSSVQRVTSGEATTGRLFWWDYYIGNLSGSKLLWGMNYASLPSERFFTGIMTVIFCYGIVGTTLFLLSLVYFFFSKRGFSQCVCIMYAGLFVVAGLSDTVNMLFYFGMIIVGDNVYRNKKIIKRKIVNLNKKYG